MKKIALSVLALTSFANATLIYPIPVNVEAGKNKAVLHVEDENTKYQASLYEWIQVNGKDKLIPVSEDEAVVYPPLFKAGKKQIKIVFLKNENKSKEKAYRIVLEELQTHKAKVNGSVVNIQKMFSVPVFVKPKEMTGNVNISCKDNKLTISNDSNVHLKVLFLNDNQVNQYILPDNSKTFEVSQKEGVIRTEDKEFKYQCK